MGFVKLDEATLDSSLWERDPDRIVFLTALMMARPVVLEEEMAQLEARSLDETGWVVPAGKYGMVRTAGAGIVRRALVESAEGMACLERLGAPDPESRSSQYDGRRLVRVDGGWVVLNFAKYRAVDFTGAERQKRWRERSKGEEAEIEGLVSGFEEGWAEEASRREGEGPELNEEELGETWEGMWADFVASGVPRAVGKKGAWEAFVGGVRSQGDLEGMGRALLAYREGLAEGERPMAAAQFFGCWKSFLA